MQCGTVIGFNVSPRRLEHLTSRDNDDVYGSQWFMDSKQLANEAFRPVSPYRVPDFLAGRDAEARRSDLIGQGEAGHEPGAMTSTVLVDSGELRPTAQFHRDDETESRLRPFARRRFSTVRPFFVCILTRKPWVRLRRRRLG
jgi:hypothetical protein